MMTDHSSFFFVRCCWLWNSWCHLFFIDGVVRVERTFYHYSLRNLAKNRFDPLDALTYTLIFDTTPVAFGALGIPVTTLAAITGLPVMKLSAMMGRQLPLLSLFLPSYALIFYAGKFYFMKSTPSYISLGFRAGFLECWPAALVAGLSFAVIQAYIFLEIQLNLVAHLSCLIGYFCKFSGSRAS